jgi:hypothetical protein
MSFLAEISLRKSRGQTRESIIALFEADLQLEFPTEVAEAVAEAVAEEPRIVAERKASKPRPIPEDEHRCHARNRWMAEHYEGGRVKVMRDDPANLYWGRCKNKKLAEGCFCSAHREKQPCGVWNGVYHPVLARELLKGVSNPK